MYMTLAQYRKLSDTTLDEKPRPAAGEREAERDRCARILTHAVASDVDPMIAIEAIERGIDFDVYLARVGVEAKFPSSRTVPCGDAFAQGIERYPAERRSMSILRHAPLRVPPAFRRPPTRESSASSRAARAPNAHPMTDCSLGFDERYAHEPAAQLLRRPALGK